MSKDRIIPPPFRGQRGRCSWCGTTDLPPRRSSWCSDKCVEEYRKRSDPGYIRFLVKQRDKGICALCGCDADAEYRAWTDRRREVERLANALHYKHRFNVDWNGREWVFRETGNTPVDWKEVNAFRAALRAKYCPGGWTEGRSNGWDADHIVPVAEGGGECDLSNYRTLCHPCHKAVTRELAGRLAKRRRISKLVKVGDFFPELCGREVA